MTINPTNHCQFSLENLNEKAEAYKLKIEFPFGVRDPEKTFTFIKTGGIEDDTKLLDIFTKNGTCKGTCKENLPAKLFQGSDVTYAKEITEFIKQYAVPDAVPRLFCLDLKGKDNTGYLHQSISSFEESVCKFFQGKVGSKSANANEIRKLFFQGESPQIDFVFCEGTLKHDLLTLGKFEDSQVAYLNSQDGVKDFCQFTEFFMNGLKLGHRISGDLESTVTPDRYIQSISGEKFAPCKKSTVYFPPEYKEMYTPDGKTQKIFEKIFQVDASYEPNSGITTWTMGEQS